DKIIATGNDQCSGSNVTANASCTAQLPICPNPGIGITKQIACEPAGGNCADPSLVYAGMAIGFKGDSQIPSFCYKFVVTNSGNIDLTVTNVVDNKFGDLTTDFTNQCPTLFPVGSTCTFFVPADEDTGVTNTVTVNGFENLFSNAVSAVATATSQVLQAS